MAEEKKDARRSPRRRRRRRRSRPPRRLPRRRPRPKKPAAKKPAAKKRPRRSRLRKKAAAKKAAKKAAAKKPGEPPVVKARASYVRIAPRKARLVANQVRGLPIDDALTLLRFSPRGAARDIAKLIDSAAANAENNHDLVADDLLVKRDQRRRGPDAAPLPPPRPGPRDPHQQANLPHQGCADTGGRQPHGTEDPPRGLPGRLHPRLEVQLVQREGLLRLPARGHRDPRPHRGQARARRPVRRSRSRRGRARSRSTSPPRGPAS